MSLLKTFARHVGDFACTDRLQALMSENKFLVHTGIRGRIRRTLEITSTAAGVKCVLIFVAKTGALHT